MTIRSELLFWCTAASAAGVLIAATFFVTPWAAALPIAAMLAIYLAPRPRVALGFWLGVLAFVPHWITAPVGTVELLPATVATGIVLFALVMGSEKDGLRSGDKFLLLAVAATAAEVVLSTTPDYLLAALVLQGLTAYVVGRRLAVRVGAEGTINAIAVFTALCGLWSTLEILTGVRVFENLTTASDLSFWATTQERGGLGRSEGAWGHAIALGGWLSLGLPFVIASTLRWRRIAIMLTVVGVLATLSRGPILGCIIGLVLCVFFLRAIPTPRRLALALISASGAILVSMPVLNFLNAVGEELDTTQRYRAGLLDYAQRDLHLVGRAETAITNSDGRLIYRGFGSIDNAFLLTAVDAGILVAAMLAAGLVVALIRTLRGHGSVADLALAVQLVVLATVAMVAQYQAAVFFVAGVAVAMSRPPVEMASDEGGSSSRPASRATSAVKIRSRTTASPSARHASR
jgi:hypothetical protein